jgi:hypothetical protein
LVFSSPTVLHQPPAGFYDDGAQMVKLSDGSLLVTFIEIPASDISVSVVPTPSSTIAGPVTIYAMRNDGAGWSKPLPIATAPLADVVDPADPSTVLYAHCCLEAVAAGPDKSAAVMWITEDGQSSSTIHVASTTDLGRTWSEVPGIHRNAQSFPPTIALNQEGNVALTWYDFTNRAKGPGLATTYWYAHADHPGGKWSVTPVAPAFDYRTAGSVYGAGAVGDFETLVPVKGGFETAFVLGPPVSRNGPTDVYATFLPS